MHMTRIYSCILLGITKSIEQNFLCFLFFVGSEPFLFPRMEKRRRKGRAEFLTQLAKYVRERGVLNLSWPKKLFPRRI